MAHPDAPGHTWLVECFAPGVQAAQVADVNRAAAAAARRLTAGGERVEYLGATLLPDDEVVLLSFRAPSADTVRAASEGLPLECGRVVASVTVAPGAAAVDTGGASPR
jgi:hypothetical protein